MASEDSALTGPDTAMLSLAALDQLVAAAAPETRVDTVIVAFPDMQGRLVGKRMDARLFVDEAAATGVECCGYLLAVDVDMNTVGGYAISGWDTGYGDLVMRPDLSTLRRIPWLPGTALVIADVVGPTAARSRCRRGPCCDASSTGWPSGGCSPTPRRSWNSWCSTSRTARRGPAATAG